MSKMSLRGNQVPAGILILCWLSIFPTPAISRQNAVEQAVTLRSESREQRKAGNLSLALKSLVAALSLRPDHPALIYEAAQLNAMLGNHERSLYWLATLADMGLIYAPENDTSFSVLSGRKDYRDLLEQFGENAIPLLKSTVALRFDVDMPVTEGIAYDPAGERFYIGSVRSRKIACKGKGKFGMAVVNDVDSVWSVLGMRIDSARKLLWACTAALPQMTGYIPSLAGKSALLKFDLETQTLAGRYPLKDTTEAHLLGDLTITDNGDVYITDSRGPVIYRFDYEREILEEFVRSREFVNLQGIDFSIRHQAFYVADYSRGIFRIEQRTKAVDLLPANTGTTLLGIDGLYVHGDDLIAIQNGIRPNRVVRFHLDHQGEINSWKVLEANHPLFDEPTLGVVVGNAFVFIANSQWGKSENPGADFDRTIIMTIDLPQ